MYKRDNLEIPLNKALYKNADLDSKIIVRTCLNVPIKNGEVVDKTRIKEALPLLEELKDKAKRIVIMAHLGRPEGRDMAFSLEPVRQVLEVYLKEKITLIDDINADLDMISEDYKESERIFLLENVRFWAGEKDKDIDKQIDFAKKLSKFGDIFINDAFADYRESASTYQIAKLMPAYLGPLLYKEVKSLSMFTNAQRPFVAVLGGAKLSEKIDVIKSLGKAADYILLGGGLVYTLLKAKGYNIGKSLFDEEKLEVAKEIIEEFSDKLILPKDHIAIEEFKEPKDEKMYTVINDVNIPDNLMGVDIGPNTVEEFKNYIGKAKSILWNGPLGVFEWNLIGNETKNVAQAMVENKEAYKLAGGGDSISAINKYNIKGFDHICTGGGAMLAFLAYENFSTLDIILNQV